MMQVGRTEGTTPVKKIRESRTGLRDALNGAWESVHAPKQVRLVVTFVQEFGRRHLGTYAAAATYCMLLSVFPALILVSAILPYTGLSENDVVGFLLQVLPDESASLVIQVCDNAYQTSGVTLPISILLMLWSSGFGMMMLTRGLNHINDVRETRNYVLLRLLSTFYTIVVLAVMLAVLFLQIFVRQIQDLWRTTFPDVDMPEFLTSTFRYVVIFAVLMILFVMLFSNLPAKRRKPLSQLPGAIVAAVGWEVFSAIFSLYVRLSQSINSYYGTLTTAVVLMLWVYWCLYILLVGAFVNCFIELWRPAPEDGDDSDE